MSELSDHLIVTENKEGGVFHFDWTRGLEVKDATRSWTTSTGRKARGRIGKGVFATTPIPVQTFIPVVGEYIQNPQRSEEYLIPRKSNNWFVEGEPTSTNFEEGGVAFWGASIAHIINEPEETARPNCLMRWNGIVVQQAIRPGEELTVFYGQEYDREQYHFSPGIPLTRLSFQDDGKDVAASFPSSWEFIDDDIYSQRQPKWASGLSKRCMAAITRNLIEVGSYARALQTLRGLQEEYWGDHPLMFRDILNKPRAAVLDFVQYKRKTKPKPSEPAHHHRPPPSTQSGPFGTGGGGSGPAPEFKVGHTTLWRTAGAGRGKPSFLVPETLKVWWGAHGGQGEYRFDRLISEGTLGVVCSYHWAGRTLSRFPPVAVQCSVVAGARPVLSSVVRLGGGPHRAEQLPTAPVRCATPQFVRTVSGRTLRLHLTAMPGMDGHAGDLLERHRGEAEWANFVLQVGAAASEQAAAAAAAAAAMGGSAGDAPCLSKESVLFRFVAGEHGRPADAAAVTYLAGLGYSGPGEAPVPLTGGGGVYPAPGSRRGANGAESKSGAGRETKQEAEREEAEREEAEREEAEREEAEREEAEREGAEREEAEREEAEREEAEREGAEREGAERSWALGVFLAASVLPPWLDPAPLRWDEPDPSRAEGFGLLCAAVLAELYGETLSRLLHPNPGQRPAPERALAAAAAGDQLRPRRSSASGSAWWETYSATQPRRRQSQVPAMQFSWLGANKVDSAGLRLWLLGQNPDQSEPLTTSALSAVLGEYVPFLAATERPAASRPRSSAETYPKALMRAAEKLLRAGAALGPAAHSALARSGRGREKANLMQDLEYELGVCRNVPDLLRQWAAAESG